MYEESSGAAKILEQDRREGRKALPGDDDGPATNRASEECCRGAGSETPSRGRWVLKIALILFAVATIGAYVATLRATHAGFVYPLDDAYIGMAIAKSVAREGIWGISGQFASGSSTPGFTLLLAGCYAIFGLGQYWALILAVIASGGCVFAADHLMRDLSLRVRFAGLILLVLLTPLHTMAMLGMEHALQILLCLLFLDLALEGAVNWRLLTVSTLMVSVRYEGLFLIAGASLVFALRRRWRDAALLAMAGWIPVLAFGVYFKSHGGEWLPNSVLLKGGAGIHRIHDFLNYGFHMAPLMAVITWAAWQNRRTLNAQSTAFLIIATVAMWLHFWFAGYGWVYRYEAYLIAIGVSLIVMLYSQRRISTMSALIALAPLFVHAIVATVSLPQCSRAVYSQQLQTARLAASLAVPIAVNDVGAVAYFSKAPVLDLVGLTSQDIFEARRRGPYTTSIVRDAMQRHGIKVLAVYDTWFPDSAHAGWGGPPLPAEYISVGKLHSWDAHGFLGADTVSYYAVSGAENQLREALKRLQSSLPQGDTISFAER